MAAINFDDVIARAIGPQGSPQPNEPAPPAGTSPDGTPAPTPADQQPAADFTINVPSAPAPVPASPPQPEPQPAPAPSAPAEAPASGGPIDFNAILQQFEQPQAASPPSQSSAQPNPSSSEPVRMSMLPFEYDPTKNAGNEAANRAAASVGPSIAQLPVWLMTHGIRFALPKALEDLLLQNWQGLTGGFDNTPEGQRAKADAGVNVGLTALGGAPGAMGDESLVSSLIRESRPASITRDGVPTWYGRSNSPGRVNAEIARQSATQLGMPMSAAAASGGDVLPAFAAWLKDIPGVGHYLQKDAEQAKGALSGRLESLRQDFGNAGREGAGYQVKSDLSEWVKNNSEKEASDLFKPVEQALGDQIGPMSHTTDAIAELAGRSGEQYADASAIVDRVNKQLNRSQAANNRGEPMMTFAGMLALKKDLGNLISGKITAEPGTDMEAVKTLYGAVAKDMEDLAGPVGTSTRSLYDQANNVFMNDIMVRRKLFSGIVGAKGDASAAAVMDNIRAMASEAKGTNSFGLIRVKNTVSPETWDHIKSALLDELGKTDNVGEWSFGKFAKSWDDKLSEDAKDTLFGTKGSADRDALEHIANVSRQYAKVEKFRNTSKSGVVTGVLGVVATIAAGHPLLAVKEALGGFAFATVLARSKTAVPLTKWGEAWQKFINNPSTDNHTALLNAGRTLKSAFDDAGIPVDALVRAGVLGEQSSGEPPSSNAQPSTAPSSNETPPVEGAKKAADGHWYVPDPKRPGKYLQVHY